MHCGIWEGDKEERAKKGKGKRDRKKQGRKQGTDITKEGKIEKENERRSPFIAVSARTERRNEKE